MNETANKIATSIEVAAAIQMRHDNLLRSIRTCSRYIKKADSGFALSNLWRESTYTGNKGAVYPCYLVTETGCRLLHDMPRGRNGRTVLNQYINSFLETN